MYFQRTLELCHVQFSGSFLKAQYISIISKDIFCHFPLGGGIDFYLVFFFPKSRNTFEIQEVKEKLFNVCSEIWLPVLEYFI